MRWRKSISVCAALVAGVAAGSIVETDAAAVDQMVDIKMSTLRGLENPDHGSLLDASGDGRLIYTPTAGYFRSDKATFLADVGSRKFKLVYSIHVSSEFDERNWSVCDKTYWRISLADIEATATLAGFVSPTSPLNYQLNQVDISLNFANLANGAVGETTGHNITLDDDGNGYSWFIDSTPESNDEFLPTSNPNEWIAKAGSEAAGKMDLLTVLLHEYGHALGLDHDESTHRLMSEELQPGVRRTVSDAEMA